MAGPLLPGPMLVRASSHLARRFQSTASARISYRNASSSSSIQHFADTIRDDQETDEADHQAGSPHLRRPKDASFSHFFDKRMQAPTTAIDTSPRRPKASYSITAASRHAVAVFRDAIDTRSPDQIIRAYASLVQAQRRHALDVQANSSKTEESSEIHFPLRKNDVQTAIRHLIQHAQGERYMKHHLVDACHVMFQDMSQLFGFRIAPTDLHRQLHSYCLAKSPLYDPVQGFERLRADHPDWQTTSVDWDMVISYLARREQYDRAVKVWNDMLDCGVRPEKSLRNTMVKVYLAADSAAEAIGQVQELAREEGSLGIHTLTTTVEGLCRLAEDKKLDGNLTYELHALANSLRKALDSSRQAATNSSAWQALLYYEAIVKGPAHALQTAKKACKPGMLGSSTICVLLRLHVDELNDLQSSDEALELLYRVQTAIDPERTIKVDDNAYSTLMLGLLNRSEAQDDADLISGENGNIGTLEQSQTPPSPNQIHEAQNLYDHVRALGVPATPLLVKPLLTAYCEAFLPSLPSAMKLVRDMLEQRSSVSPTTRRSSQTSTVDITTIQPVLNACIKLKDLSSARDLLSRLFDAQIPLTAKDKSHLIRRLITIANSWPEVFSIYRTLIRFPSPAGTRGLDSHGYHAVLTSFTTLSFPSHPGAPPEDLLSLLADMRATSTPPTCTTYTRLLDYYAKLATPSYLGVHLTHELLKRDAQLEPDLPLINALMNAYNRVGEPAMVVAIWESLTATRQGVDGVTMSVVFDTAGRHGLLSLARPAVREGRGVMTKGAWDSWLECLARCGRLEEAIEVAFGEMRRTLLREALEGGTLPDQPEGLTLNELLMRSSQAAVRDSEGQIVGPDAKTLSTLLKFTARERDRRKRQAGMPLLTGPTTASTARAKGTSIWHSLRARIREDFSWLYPHVKHIGEDTPV